MSPDIVIKAPKVVEAVAEAKAGSPGSPKQAKGGIAQSSVASTVAAAAAALPKVALTILPPATGQPLGVDAEGQTGDNDPSDGVGGSMASGSAIESLDVSVPQAPPADIDIAQLTAPTMDRVSSFIAAAPASEHIMQVGTSAFSWEDFSGGPPLPKCTKQHIPPTLVCREQTLHALASVQALLTTTRSPGLRAGDLR